MNIQQLDRLIILGEGILWALICIYVLPQMWRELKEDWRDVFGKKNSAEDTAERQIKLPSLIISNNGAKRKVEI